MGGFYGSVQVRTTGRAAVKAAAEAVALKRSIHCLIGPELNGWVGIYPEGNGQDDSVGLEIAQLLPCDVLHLLVHDDDVLAFWLWRDRELVDSYWSKPGYFGEENRAEEESRRGDPEMFRAIIDDTADRLAAVLDREESVTFEYERLQRLAKLLGIQNAVTAYEYLKGGERTDIKGWRKFEEIPASQIASQAEQRRAEKNRIKYERAALRKAGVLLYIDERKHGVALGVCASENGFAIVLPAYVTGAPSIGQLQEPWKDIRLVAVDARGHLTSIASDSAATRIALAAGERIRIWNASGETWEHLLDVPEADHAIGVAISPDGKLVAHASRLEIVVTEIANGRRIFATPKGYQRHMAFHSSSQWLALTGGTIGLISLQNKDRARQLFVGGKSSLSTTFARHFHDSEQKQEALIEAQLNKIQTLERERETPTLTHEQIEKTREEAEIALVEMRCNLRTMKAGHATALANAAACGAENVMCVGFSRDERWIYCGTTHGLRVYGWDSFPKESGSDTPAPIWHYTPPRRGPAHSPQQINAIVEEIDGSGLVFGGWAGKLWRLDLHTGEVRHLISIPSGGGVVSLAISRNGDALCVFSNFSHQLNRGTLLPDSNALEVWDYRRLRDQSTPAT